jgi:hypothetical protein
MLNVLFEARLEALKKIYSDNGLIPYDERVKQGLPRRQMLGVTIMVAGKPHWYTMIYNRQGEGHVQLRPAEVD